MIRNCKINLAGFTIIVLLLTSLSPGQSQQKKHPPAKIITGTGCIGPGVEAHCILLTDASTHTLYNLYFSGKKPLLGSTIHFAGKKHNGVTSCMQGEAVDVTKWTKLDNSCTTR